MSGTNESWPIGDRIPVGSQPRTPNATITEEDEEDEDADEADAGSAACAGQPAALLPDSVRARTDLGHLVQHLWVVEWDLPEPYTAQVLPHPNVNLCIMPGHSRISGTGRRVFLRRLEGAGRVLGVTYRPRRVLPAAQCAGTLAHRPRTADKRGLRR